jgi:DNA polymerase III delta subunit
MSILVFHGDNSKDSRDLLQKAIAQEREAGREINALAGDKLLAKDLSSTLATANLFSQETIVIENLLSRLKSKEKDRCLETLAAYEGDKNIILWDKKAATKLTINKLGKTAKVSESKAPQLLFTFLDAVVPGNTKKALSLLQSLATSTDEILIFTMLARHIANLIIVDSGTGLKFAPWQIGKLKAQAKAWDQTQLVQFHDRLIELDEQIKTGASRRSYQEHLDMLLIDLLG